MPRRRLAPRKWLTTRHAKKLGTASSTRRTERFYKECLENRGQVQPYRTGLNGLQLNSVHSFLLGFRQPHRNDFEKYIQVRFPDTCVIHVLYYDVLKFLRNHLHNIQRRLYLTWLNVCGGFPRAPSSITRGHPSTFSEPTYNPARFVIHIIILMGMRDGVERGRECECCRYPTDLAQVAVFLDVNNAVNALNNPLPQFVNTRVPKL